MIHRDANAALLKRITLTAALLTPSIAHAEAIVVARYSVVDPTPTLAQIDPLAEVIDSALPATVTRVGEAIEVLLAPSGYRLTDGEASDASRQMLLALPLPRVHRVLGPMPLRHALTTLAGPAFVLVEDPVHRLVSFERCAVDPRTP